MQYSVLTSSVKKDNNPPNPAVEALYSTIIRNGVHADSFEFRKQLAVTALNAFGTKDFYEWYIAQHQSPACGDSHGKYLLDTLKFIQTGKRDMSVETWGSILFMTDEGDDISEAKDKFIEDFFGSVQYQRNRNLVDVIQSWLSQPTGANDLLYSLHILFGKL